MEINRLKQILQYPYNVVEVCHSGRWYTGILKKMDDFNNVYLEQPTRTKIMCARDIECINILYK